MLKPCANISILPGCQVRRDVGLVDRALRRVRREHHDHVRPRRRVGDRQHLHAGRLGLGGRLAARAQADAHVDAAVLQIQRVRVALRAVADDGDLLALDEGEVRVLVVVDRCHCPSQYLQFVDLDSLESQACSDATPNTRRSRRRSPRYPRTCAPSSSCWPRAIDSRPVRHHLEDAERPQHLDQPVDLVFRARDLDHQRRRRHVDDARAEHVRELQDCERVSWRRRHLDQREVARHRRLIRDVVDAQHVHQLVEVRLDAARAAVRRCRRRWSCARRLRSRCGRRSATRC